MMISRKDNGGYVRNIRDITAVILLLDYVNSMQKVSKVSTVINIMP